MNRVSPEVPFSGLPCSFGGEFPPRVGYFSSSGEQAWHDYERMDAWSTLRTLHAGTMDTWHTGREGTSPNAAAWGARRPLPTTLRLLSPPPSSISPDMLRLGIQPQRPDVTRRGVIVLIQIRLLGWFKTRRARVAPTAYAISDDCVVEEGQRQKFPPRVLRPSA